jgi:HEAT repeat protein
MEIPMRTAACWIGLALLLASSSTLAQPGTKPRRETEINGKPITAWLADLESEKADAVLPALSALMRAGPEARPAVPALVKLLSGEANLTQVLVVLTLSKIGPEAVPALRKAMDSRSPRTRELAAKALGLIGDPAAVPSVLAYLNDGEPAVRRAVMVALRQLNARAAAPLMKKQLEDRDEDTRLEAALSLWHLAEAKEAIACLRGLLGSSSEDVVLRALAALGEMGPTAAPATAELEPLLKSPSTEVRLSAATTHHRISGKSEPGLKVIRAALEDKETRLAAVAALTTFAGDEAADTELANISKNADVFMRREAASALLSDAGLTDPDPAVRWWSALAGLRRKPASARLDALILTLREGLRATPQGDPLADDILSITYRDRAALALMALLRQGSSRVRVEAARLLSMPGLDLRPMLDDLLAYFASEDLFLRRAVAEAVGRVGPEVLPKLRSRLDDADPRVREAAARAIGIIGVPARGTRDALLARLRDPEPPVRIAAALAYWRVEAESETPLALLDNLLKDVDIPERWEAVEAIGIIAVEARPAIKGLTEVLVNGLKDRDARVRATAAKWLWRRVAQSKPVVPLMRDILAGRDSLAKIIAIETLGELDEEARPGPLLLAALEDRDATLRLAAIEGLARQQDTATLLRGLDGTPRTAEAARLAFALLGKGKEAADYLAARAAGDEPAQKRLAKVLHPIE